MVLSYLTVVDKRERDDVSAAYKSPLVCYRWVSEAWSPCSASCNSGWKHRSVRCQQIREDGFDDPNLPHGACAHLIKPEDASRCNEGPCDTQWTTGPWTSVSWAPNE